MNKKKICRFNSVLQKKIVCIINESFYKSELITITHIETSSSYFESKIYVVTFNSNDNIVKELNKYSDKIRYILSKKIRIYRMPKIKFIYDTKFNEILHINYLLEKLK